jgi:hypothetical protein
MSESEGTRHINFKKYNIICVFTEALFFFQIKSKLLHSNADGSSMYNEQYSQHNKIYKNIFPDTS